MVAERARELTKTARQELVQAVRARYAAGSRDTKSGIVEVFASVSGYHRKSAIRILNGAAYPEEAQRRHPRPRIYDEAARQGLIVLWEASDRVCGKRLKALFPIVVPALERNGHRVLVYAGFGGGFHWSRDAFFIQALRVPICMFRSMATDSTI